MSMITKPPLLLQGQLEQMRSAASAEMRMGGHALQGAVAGQGAFAGYVKAQMDRVAQNQSESRRLASAFEVGDPNVSLADVMIQSQKSSVSFQALVEVRNKLLSAYQEVMNMPV